MPKLSVSQSQIISAPLGRVYDEVRDFKSWPEWSPWLVAEPECPLTYSPSGHAYSWNGEIIGSGSMTVSNEEKNKWIDYDLEFLKPWKSKAVVRMSFLEKAGGVEVTWSMDSSLPFFLFWMKGMMVGLIGMDYERGLKMLKDHVETGEVPSSLEFVGEKVITGFSYLGKQRTCTIAEMPKTMEADFGEVEELLKDPQLIGSGHAFGIYHKWDLENQMVCYTIGVPVTVLPKKAPKAFVKGVLPSLSVYAIRHEGPYRHLGNAWASGIFHGRAKKFHQAKRVHPFEFYEKTPTEGHDPVTLVCFPVKG
ncbi:SRPBCC family protein [bacterium]|nr:SRPBCC family protein [bacterium]